MALEKYSAEIGRRLEVDSTQIHLFWKGRVALYATLKAMGIGAGDEVVLPAYTCVVVPMAILFTGATPVYVDIHSQSYTMDIDGLKSAISNRTKAVITQNTFGLSQNLKTIQDLGANHGFYVIEDCTHGFGGTYQGRPNGSYSDVSFYSTQWNKPYSTGLGGFAAVHRPELKSAMSAQVSSAVAPSSKELLLLKALMSFRNLTGGLTDSAAFVNLYRRISTLGWVPGSSSADEFDPKAMPQDYLKSHSLLQAKDGLKQLAKLDEHLSLRRSNARRYSEFLALHSLNHVPRHYDDDHAFLRYPLQVSDRNEWMRLGLKSGINFGEWFNSPLHPEQGSLEQWGLDVSKFPQAVMAGNRVVNLPTDIRDVSKVLEFIKSNPNLVVPV